jgi:hypothetical protein
VVLSFWFTCDPRMKFDHFLDGAAHKTFVREETAVEEKEL